MKKKSAAGHYSIETVALVLVALLASCFRTVTVFALARPPVPGLKQDDPMSTKLIVGWLILIVLGAVALKRGSIMRRVIVLLVLTALLALWYVYNMMIVG